MSTYVSDVKIGDVKIDPQANLHGRNILIGNIFIGPYVVLDNVTIRGNFSITQKNRLTYIIDSILLGEGNISDCGVFESTLFINGDSDNFVIDCVANCNPRTYNDVRIDDEGVVVLEKETNVSDNIIIVD